MDELLIAAGGLLLGLIGGLLLSRLTRRSYQQRIEDQLAADRLRLEEENTTRLHGLEQELRQRAREQQEQDKADLADEREEIQREQEKLQRHERKLQSREEKFHQREGVLDTKLEATDRRDAKLAKREQEMEQWHELLNQREVAIAEQEERLQSELSRVAGLSREEARSEYFKILDGELAEEQNKLIKRRVAAAEERAKQLACELVARATQRYAAEHTAETTISKIELPDEEMKGRIIGKEGRNIRAFEQISGVDLIIDDTPGVITISCFDGVRREIARRALADLIADGRIHPARIEEVFARVRQDMDRQVAQLGEDAAYECEVSGLHPQLLKLLGKLQFRTSYGQNVLQHTKEVAFLCGAMAGDLGLDPKLGRRCGLMHDIGKAIDHEQEGSHPQLGFEALKRYGEEEVVANAALAHHEGFEVKSVYTTLVAAADAISAARPGARRENIERYIKRLQQLEEIAIEHDGVMKAYAIQAGRELRVIVNAHQLDDRVLSKVARSIARRIEDEVSYPGEVKVTMIRETRASSVAR
ncbi:MAG: ribonuclease Y [Planctomycetota bacterium]